MGKRGKEIVGLNVDELIEKLNKAFADEWLAYYQYWIGSEVAVGPMRGAVVAELVEHAGDELRHAGMLSERILTLGGTPLLSPEDWFDYYNCEYATPEEPDVPKLLEQNIEAERCAIDVYHELVNMTEGKDQVTYNLALEVMEDEVEHEEDLEALMEDIEVMKKKA
ncbi:MAG: ferritin-like domain-containing protein [Candidatus Thorarchaeota archaeon]